MAGIAAGLGGLAAGLAQGIKVGSDLRDAEERRGLMAEQKKAAELANQKAQGELDYDKERKEAIEAAFAEPGRDPLTYPDRLAPTLRAAGETVPEQAGQASSGLGDLGVLRRLNDAMVKVDAKHGKLNIGQLLEGAKRFRELQSEGVLDAWQRVAAGDHDGAVQLFNSTGKIRLPEGTRFETREEDDGFGAGRKIKNYYAISPDGRQVNYRDMMRNTLSPEKLMEVDSSTGYRIADLAVKREAGQQLAAYREGVLKGNAAQLTEFTRHHKVLEDESRARRILLAEQQGDLTRARVLQAEQRASDTARDQIFHSFGVSKEMTADKLSMLSPKEQEAYRASLLQATSAHTVWLMNMKDGKPTVSIGDAQALVRNAGQIGIKDILTDPDGNSYVKFGNKNIVVPSVFGPKPSSPAAPPAGPARGIAPQSSEPPPPMPAGIAPGVDQRVNAARQRAIEANQERADFEAGEESRRLQLERDARSFTLERIKQMNPAEARNVLRLYQQFLTPEQAREVRRRM